MLLKKHAVQLQQANAQEVLIAKPVTTVVVVNIAILVENVEFVLQKKHQHQRKNLLLRKHPLSVQRLQRNGQDVVELHNQVVLIVGSINFQC